MTPTWLRVHDLDSVAGVGLGVVIGLAFWLTLITVTGLQLGPLPALMTAAGVLVASAMVVLALMHQVEPGSERESGMAPKSRPARPRLI